MYAVNIVPIRAITALAIITMSDMEVFQISSFFGGFLFPPPQEYTPCPSIGSRFLYLALSSSSWVTRPYRRCRLQYLPEPQQHLGTSMIHLSVTIAAAPIVKSFDPVQIPALAAIGQNRLTCFWIIFYVDAVPFIALHNFRNLVWMDGQGVRPHWPA